MVPGTITTVAKCPPEFVQELRKTPKAIVKFFHENEFQDVHKAEHILPYNCDRKEEFIRKGQSVNKNQNHGDVDLLAKFESDVVTAEKLTGGDMNILETLGEVAAGKRRIDYSDLGFGASKPKRKRGEEGGSPRRMGTDIGQAVVYKRLGKGGTGRVVIQHKMRIMEQPQREVTEEDMKGASGWFKCYNCGFTCSRLNVMVWHNKAHLNKVFNYDSGIKIPGRRRRRGGARGRPSKRGKGRGGKGKENLDHAHTNGDVRVGQRDMHDTEQILMDWDDDDEGGDRSAPPANGAGSDDGYSDNDNDYPPPQPKFERQPMPKAADLNSAFDALLAATPSTTHTPPGRGHTYTKNDSDSDYSDWEKYYARDSGSGSEDEEVEQESDIKSLCENKDEEKNHVREAQEDGLTPEINNKVNDEENGELKPEEDNEDKSSPSETVEAPVPGESDGHMYEREELQVALQDQDDKSPREEELETSEKNNSRSGAAEEGTWEPSDDNSDLVEYMEEPEERTPHMSPAEAEEETADAQPEEPEEPEAVEHQKENEDSLPADNYPDGGMEESESPPEAQEEPVDLAKVQHHDSPVGVAEGQFDGEAGENIPVANYREPSDCEEEEEEEEEMLRVHLGQDGAEIIDADEDSLPERHARHDKEPAPSTVAHTKIQETSGESGTTYMLVAVDAHGNTVPTVPTPSMESDGNNLVAVEATMEDGAARTLYIDPTQLGPNVDLNNLVLHIDTSGQEHVIIPPSSTHEPTHTPDSPKHHHHEAQETSTTHSRQYDTPSPEPKQYSSEAINDPSDHSDDSKPDAMEPADLRQQVRRADSEEPKPQYHHHAEESSPSHYQDEPSKQYQEEPASPSRYQDESSNSREYHVEHSRSIDYQEEPYQEEPSDLSQYQDQPSDLSQYQRKSPESRRYQVEEPTSPQRYQEVHSEPYQDEPSDLSRYQADRSSYQSEPTPSHHHSRHSHQHTGYHGERSNNPQDYSSSYSNVHPDYSQTTGSAGSDSYPSSPAYYHRPTIPDSPPEHHTTTHSEYRSTSPEQQTITHSEYRSTSPEQQTITHSEYRSTSPEQQTITHSEYRSTSPEQQTITHSEYRTASPERFTNTSAGFRFSPDHPTTTHQDSSPTTTTHPDYNTTTHPEYRTASPEYHTTTRPDSSPSTTSHPDYHTTTHPDYRTASPDYHPAPPPPTTHHPDAYHSPEQHT